MAKIVYTPEEKEQVTNANLTILSVDRNAAIRRVEELESELADTKTALQGWIDRGVTPLGETPPDPLTGLQTPPDSHPVA